MDLRNIEDLLTPGDVFRINDENDNNHGDVFIYHGFDQGHFLLTILTQTTELSALSRLATDHLTNYEILVNCLPTPNKSGSYSKQLLEDLKLNVGHLVESYVLGLRTDYDFSLANSVTHNDTDITLTVSGFRFYDDFSKDFGLFYTPHNEGVIVMANGLRVDGKYSVLSVLTENGFVNLVDSTSIGGSREMSKKYDQDFQEPQIYATLGEAKIAAHSSITQNKRE